ncbi:hypothetical protein GCM10025734_23360 [Kitasatospora paranensis]
MAEIVVFGANGAIGRCIVTEALARGHRVTAAVRDPAKYQGLSGEVIRGDVLVAEDVARAAEEGTSWSARSAAVTAPATCG